MTSFPPHKHLSGTASGISVAARGRSPYAITSAGLPFATMSGGGGGWGGIARESSLGLYLARKYAAATNNKGKKRGGGTRRQPNKTRGRYLYRGGGTAPGRKGEWKGARIIEEDVRPAECHMPRGGIEGPQSSSAAPSSSYSFSLFLLILSPLPPFPVNSPSSFSSDFAFFLFLFILSLSLSPSSSLLPCSSFLELTPVTKQTRWD